MGDSGAVCQGEDLAKKGSTVYQGVPTYLSGGLVTKHRKQLIFCNDSFIIKG